MRQSPPSRLRSIKRDLCAQPGGARGADQARGAAADDDQIVFSRRRRIAPARRMTVFDQLLVMSIVGKQHFIDRPSAGSCEFKQRHTGRHATFLLLFRFAQRFARNARDEHNHGDGREQAEVFQNLPIEIRSTRRLGRPSASRAAAPI